VRLNAKIYRSGYASSATQNTSVLQTKGFPFINLRSNTRPLCGPLWPLAGTLASPRRRDQSSQTERSGPHVPSESLTGRYSAISDDRKSYYLRQPSPALTAPHPPCCAVIFHMCRSAFFTPVNVKEILNCAAKKPPTRSEHDFLSLSPAETGSTMWALSLVGKP
jgi:hypothetical protein